MRTRRRCRDDDGVALVEFALVAPLLALLVAGILEFGTLWRDNLTVSTSTRAAARVVSNLGDERLADYEALLTLDAALGGVDGLTIEGVLIYNASAADGAPHSACFDGSGDPQASGLGECNFYTEAQVQAMGSLSCAVTCVEFPDHPTCAGGLTVYFCPQSDRETDMSLGSTSVGIWVRTSRGYFTGMFPGDGVTMTDQTVMRAEPR